MIIWVMRVGEYGTALKTAGDYRGGKVAVVICGRNIALDTFRAALESVS